VKTQCFGQATKPPIFEQIHPLPFLEVIRNITVNEAHRNNEYASGWHLVGYIQRKPDLLLYESLFWEGRNNEATRKLLKLAQKWVAKNRAASCRGRRPVLLSGDPCFSSADYPAQIHHGVPVLTVTKLEQMIPLVGVVSVERTPTVPFGDSLVVLAMAFGGLVIGCDSENKDVTLL
jgi:hypothetical protein